MLQSQSRCLQQTNAEKLREFVLRDGKCRKNIFQSSLLFLAFSISIKQLRITFLSNDYQWFSRLSAELASILQNAFFVTSNFEAVVRAEAIPMLDQLMDNGKVNEKLETTSIADGR